MAAYLASNLLEMTLFLWLGREILTEWRYISPSYLHALMFSLLLAAPLSLLLHTSTQPWVIPVWPVVVSDTLTPVASSTERMTFLPTVVFVYLAGLGCSLLTWSTDILQLLKLTLRAQAVSTASQWSQALRSLEAPSNLQVKVSQDILTPLTWGTLYPVILIPPTAEDWDSQSIRWTLIHERAHIVRKDWLTQQISRLICCLFWPIPVVWNHFAELCLHAERAADDKVIADGASHVDYAKWLLKQAYGHRSGSVALSAPATLKSRITHILNQHADRAANARYIPVYVLVIASLTVGLSSIEFGSLYLKTTFPADRNATKINLPPETKPTIVDIPLVTRLGAVVELPPITLPARPPTAVRPPATGQRLREMSLYSTGPPQY